MSRQEATDAMIPAVDLDPALARACGVAVASRLLREMGDTDEMRAELARLCDELGINGRAVRVRYWSGVMPKPKPLDAA